MYFPRTKRNLYTLKKLENIFFGESIFFYVRHSVSKPKLENKLCLLTFFISFFFFFLFFFFSYFFIRTFLVLLYIEMPFSKSSPDQCICKSDFGNLINSKLNTTTWVFFAYFSNSISSITLFLHLCLHFRFCFLNRTESYANTA